MVSSLTSRGARVTVAALLNGAFDYITKPAQMDSREAASTQLSTLLSPKLQAAAFRKRVSAPAPRAARGPESLAPRLSRPPRNNEHRVLAIGSSTGGPAALALLLGGLPHGFALPIVIAQHMPETFTRLLAERLSEVSRFKVREAVAGETLRSGEAWIAPGNFHLTVAQARGGELCLELNSDAPVNCCRPSIDVLLQSLSVSAGRHTLAVLLTGMGHDGRDGAKAIRSAGGEVLAQDEASSVVWGIPGAVVAAGLASAVIPITSMAREIAARTRAPLAKAGT
jgi:two-component system chemotaxis response regulator CheB